VKTFASASRTKTLIVLLSKPIFSSSRKIETRSQKLDRATVIPAFEDGPHMQECRAPSEGLALR
jgi:hypothetical protein